MKDVYYIYPLLLTLIKDSRLFCRIENAESELAFCQR